MEQGIAISDETDSSEVAQGLNGKIIPPSLAWAMKKPFDVLAEGLLSEKSGRQDGY